jgi:hypothetical protein
MRQADAVTDLVHEHAFDVDLAGRHDCVAAGDDVVVGALVHGPGIGNVHQSLFALGREREGRVDADRHVDLSSGTGVDRWGAR